MLKSTKRALEQEIGKWVEIGNNRHKAEDFLELVAQCDGDEKKDRKLSEELWKLFDIRDRKGKRVPWSVFCKTPTVVESMSRQGGKVIKFGIARSALLEAYGLDEDSVYDRAVSALNTSMDIIRAVSPFIANTWDGGYAFSETGSVRVVEVAIKKHFSKTKKTNGRSRRNA